MLSRCRSPLRGTEQRAQRLAEGGRHQGHQAPPSPHGLPRFPAQRGRRGDPLGKLWERGQSEDTGENPPPLLSGPGPSPSRPALRLGGGGADKGSRTALPAPKGGGGPRTHPPVVGCRVPRISCCIHADTDSLWSRQVPALPGVRSFFIVDGRATLALTTPWRVKPLAQRSTLVVSVASH